LLALVAQACSAFAQSKPRAIDTPGIKVAPGFSVTVFDAARDLYFAETMAGRVLKLSGTF